MFSFEPKKSQIMLFCLQHFHWLKTLNQSHARKFGLTCNSIQGYQVQGYRAGPHFVAVGLINLPSKCLLLPKVRFISGKNLVIPGDFLRIWPHFFLCLKDTYSVVDPGEFINNSCFSFALH